MVLKTHLIKDMLPITEIASSISATDRTIAFCFKILERTLSSLINNRYNDFDAHTRSSCCHGMAVFAKQLIEITKKYDLENLHKEVLKKGLSPHNYQQLLIPKPLVELCHLYILNQTLEISQYGIRTNYRKLSDIHPIGVNFCNTLVKNLQLNYGNQVAGSYEHFIKEMPQGMHTCGISVDLWGKYATNTFLRIDNRGLTYAASLYSMQIVLGYLIHNKSFISVTNDILDTNGNTSRYIRILQGDGKEGFKIVSLDQLHSQDLREMPIVVFGGCAITSDPSSIVSKLDDWLNSFPNLVLAHETTYPQFPYVNQEFISSPIVPEEEILQKVIQEHSGIGGLSLKDPSFYYLNHIYVLSLQELSNHSYMEQNPLSFEILSSVRKKKNI